MTSTPMRQVALSGEDGPGAPARTSPTISAGAPGPPDAPRRASSSRSAPVGEADIYANARVMGQGYTSTIINDADAFAFPRGRLVTTPFGKAIFGGYHAFTWIRSAPPFAA